MDDIKTMQTNYVKRDTDNVIRMSYQNAPQHGLWITRIGLPMCLGKIQSHFTKRYFIFTYFCLLLCLFPVAPEKPQGSDQVLAQFSFRLILFHWICQRHDKEDATLRSVEVSKPCSKLTDEVRKHPIHWIT